MGGWGAGDYEEESQLTSSFDISFKMVHFSAVGKFSFESQVTIALIIFSQWCFVQ